MAQRDYTGWNDESVLYLIELYKNKPVIWDPKNEDYYKKHLKLEAWEDIGRALGITGDECKNKMVNVLSSWRRERGKENKRGTDEVYRSHWFAYDALRFLKDREMPRRGFCRNVENDAENLVKYRLVGGALKLKPDIYPHKFECQKGATPKKGKRGYKKELVEFSENPRTEEVSASSSQAESVGSGEYSK